MRIDAKMLLQQMFIQPSPVPQPVQHVCHKTRSEHAHGGLCRCRLLCIQDKQFAERLLEFLFVMNPYQRIFRAPPRARKNIHTLAIFALAKR